MSLALMKQYVKGIFFYQFAKHLWHLWQDMAQLSQPVKDFITSVYFILESLLSYSLKRCFRAKKYISLSEGNYLMEIDIFKLYLVYQPLCRKNYQRTLQQCETRQVRENNNHIKYKNHL